jgi:uncharacterized protein (DUF1330 family)
MAEVTVPDVHMAGGEGGINPTPEQLDALVARHPSGPVQMVNLLKFRTTAAYPDEYGGNESADCTGEEAYQRYGVVAMEHVAKRGGHLVLLSTVDAAVLGAVDHDDWDQVAIVEYPDVAAFLDMGSDPDYLAATVHRLAGLERSVILATSAVFDASDR